jgi:hypothetical protein
LFLYNALHAIVRVRGVFAGRRWGPAVVGEGMRHRLKRFRTLLRLIGILVSAALVDTLAGGFAAGGRGASALWVLAGLVLGLAWTERRRATAGALGLGVFAVALAWATLWR